MKIIYIIIKVVTVILLVKYMHRHLETLNKYLFPTQLTDTFDKSFDNISNLVCFFFVKVQTTISTVYGISTVDNVKAFPGFWEELRIKKMPSVLLKG